MLIIPSTLTWCAVTGVNSPRDEAPERGVEGLEVEGENRAGALGREARDEAVPHLAARAGDENDGAAHQATVTRVSR
jgi:hypothetical protein